ncbi:MAG: tRNA pseudouridine(55) synthase TruB [Bacillota bacterium]|nr:tRNA pseudouridine(55) synthase TruB [Bacillota bacterium]HAN86851.1 tRNA pseudouridine(55) synthase TruB [Bacillota bacterium]
MDGLIVVNKPKGMTSHDVVVQVRRITGERSAGHTGTLDPDATGVLVVCMGRATRLSRFMMDMPKEYDAEIVFGISTDTADASGRVRARNDSFELPKEAVFSAFQRFVGHIEQVPPMVSAVRHKGKRLYELAREGITVEREPRRVTIYGIEPISPLDWPESVTLGSRGSVRVACSKGTYVRTLCEDICKSLRLEGHMGALERTMSSGFRLEEAYTLEQLSEAATAGRLDTCVRPVVEGVRGMPRCVVSEDEARHVRHGARIRSDEGRITPACDRSDYIALLRADGSLAAVGEVRLIDGREWIQPRVVF